MTVLERTDEEGGASGDDPRKPPLTFKGILLMNFGFFGIQYSFGLQQTAINPLFALIGAEPHSLPILNLAGPITGLVIQPLIGAMSDKTWHPKYGRRKPYFLIGALGCMVILFLFPFVTALWMAVLALWLLDASNNTAMEPYRAFISDRLPKSQLARGFLTQSMFVGAGAVLSNLCIFFFQRIVEGGTEAGVPYWVFAAFWVGAVCSIATVLISVLSTDEIPPSEQELAELRAQPKGLGPAIADIASAVRAMPMGMHKIGLVFAFQWYAMFIYWQFVAISIGESVYNAAPGDPGFEQAAGWTGLVNATYNGVTIVAALLLMPLAARFGAKWVGAGALFLAAVGLMSFSQIDNRYLLLVPMIGLGIAWASMMGIPYIMVASMVPQEKSGVYMGIVNMMIVIPMLVETLTFGWIFENLLGSEGTRAIFMAGVLLALAGLGMLWVNPPSEDEESDLMPLGAPGDLSVYDRVVVGSDGTASSMYAVDRAQDIALAADARIMVVSAYNPDDGADASGGSSAARSHKDLHGQQAAEKALAATVRQLNKERVRRIDTRVVAGDPAEALLKAAGNNPRNMIVVGNRGLGAADGQLLGSVPGNVVKNAVCDVLIVQTSALDEDAFQLKTADEHT